MPVSNVVTLLPMMTLSGCAARERLDINAGDVVRMVTLVRVLQE